MNELPPNTEEMTEEKKKTWYSLHAEQVRLIQFLLYHLNKYNKKEMKQNTAGMEKIYGKFTLRFE